MRVLGKMRGITLRGLLARMGVTVGLLLLISPCLLPTHFFGQPGIKKARAFTCVSAARRGKAVAGFDMSDERLRGLRLTRAILTDCSFRNSDLRGAHFDGARLTLCNFRGADLSGCDFREARLLGCDFRRADFGGHHTSWLGRHTDTLLADLRGCRYDAQTRWPAGFDPRTLGAIPD